MSRRVAHNDVRHDPILGGMGPDVHRDLPVADDPTGLLALAHATRQFQPPHSGGTPRLTIDE